MSERWRLGDYVFTINPNRYSEQYQVVGDTVTTLDGTVISQPTTLRETLSIDSIFYQHRERVVSEVSVGNADGIEFSNGKYYIWNKTTKKVRVYNNTLSTLEKEVTMPTTNENGFDVEGGFFWISESGSPTKVKKINSTGSVVSTININEGDIKGIKVIGEHIWLISGYSILTKHDMNGNRLGIIDMPQIPFSELGYQGMTKAEEYIVVLYNNEDNIGAYHVEPSRGHIVNHFNIPIATESIDIAYDGKLYIALGSDNIIRSTTGNTIMIDLYKLEKEIRTKGYINLIDDMEVKRRVFVSDYNISRLEGNLHKYRVSLNITKINRGVN